MWREPYFADAIGSGSSRIGLSPQESGRDPHISLIGPVLWLLASGEGHERIAYACGHETKNSRIPNEVSEVVLGEIIIGDEAHCFGT